MGELKRLVISLYRELLGPLSGDPGEVLKTASPKNRFVAGILEPHDGEVAEDRPIFYVDEEQVDDTDEDLYGDRDITEHSPVNPVLGPDRIPASTGLVFSVRVTGDNPVIRICATWGRYRREADSAWKRESHFAVWELSPVAGHSVLTHTDAIRHSGDTGVQVQTSIYREEGEIYSIRVSLVNRTPEPEEKQRKDEALVFQPCVRIRLYGCVPVEAETTADVYEAQFIPDIPVPRVRGMLCAAVWKEVDPALHDGELLNCVWPDGTVLEREHPDLFEEFVECDFRTELLPLAAGLVPDFDRVSFNPDPEELSELEPENIRRYFEPLLKAYRDWIRGMQTPGIADGQHEKFLEFHRATLRMMEEGVNILSENYDALLCFNFANRVIATVQKRWLGKKDFRWRAFQIAFLLILTEPLINPDSDMRKYLYLLWMPTGGGKTEAYLAVTAFLLAWRRRKSIKDGREWYGPAVLSRYTLRLLTLQQFHRMLSAVTACELLRNLKNKYGRRGWLPEWCIRKGHAQEDFIWGDYGFYAGLWVGGGITPNRLHGNEWFAGAAGFLDRGRNGSWNQHPPVSRCPACGSLLIIPDRGYSLKAGEELVLYFAVKARDDCDCEKVEEVLNNINFTDFSPLIDGMQCDVRCVRRQGDVCIWKITAVCPRDVKISRKDIENLAGYIKERVEELDSSCSPWEILSIAPYAPGYFEYGRYTGPRGGEKTAGYSILCLNPDCDLGSADREELVPDGKNYVSIYGLPEYRKYAWMKNFIPVPALFVDEVLYSRLPSVVVATVDKFARLPFEPATAALTGNVNRFHPATGFYRSGALYSSVLQREPESGWCVAGPFRPPSLIIQDEIHLIEGPLGSLTAIYETAVEALCEEGGEKPLYIASSATIRASETHVSSLFSREVFQFPVLMPGRLDGFFVRLERPSPARLLEGGSPGRIYIGLMAPGKGPLTPQVRVYSVFWREIQGCGDSERTPVVGYYNAVRELAGGRRILEQDVPQFLRAEYGTGSFPTAEDILELSSRVEPESLGILLAGIEKGEIKPDFIITTSMFGTGVDIPHLRYMLVNGQPKTTSSYIQATGRVGRRDSALVVVLYRVSRPRDLTHFEFFMQYHLSIYRYVEWSSVFPFSTGCVRRAAGPVLVSILRNSRNTRCDWTQESSAVKMRKYHESRNVRDDFDRAVRIILARNNAQPPVLRMKPDVLEKYLLDRYEGRDRWIELAERTRPVFTDYRNRAEAVILGDLRHEYSASSRVVYRKVPQSLRNVEGHINVEIHIGQHTSPGGSIRKSQYIRVYGPGAIYEARNKSAVFLLNDPPEESRVMKDPVLTGYLRSAIRALSGDSEGYQPAVYEVRAGEGLDGYGGDTLRARVFQEWYLCSLHDYLWNARDRNAFCPECGNRQTSLNNSRPVRFIQICEEGHMDDIQWDDVVHRYGRGGSRDCSSRVFRWISGSHPSEVRIECMKCRRYITLGELYGLSSGDRLTCTGRYPERETRGEGPRRNMCRRPARIVLRMASSVRVAETVSLLLVWPRADEFGRILVAYPELRGRIMNIVEMYRRGRLGLQDVSDDYTHVLEEYRNILSETEYGLLEKNNPGRDERTLESFERRLEEIRAMEGRGSLTHTDIMSLEYRNLLKGMRIGREEYLETGRKYLEISPERKVDVGPFTVAGIDLLSVLEVQIGYRRYDPETGTLVSVGTVSGPDRKVYFPGMLMSGEGLFFTLNADSIRKDGENYRKWLNAWKNPGEYRDKGYLFRMRNADEAWELHPFFVLLHTLSHLFIRAISAYAGYSSATLRERIYVVFPESRDAAGGKKEPREGGFVIYTASEDEGGSMGGLISLVNENTMKEIFRKVVDLALHCSNDPVCSEHTYSAGKHGGAACYACVLVSETSCEYRNLWLDRNLVIENTDLLNVSPGNTGRV